MGTLVDIPMPRQMTYLVCVSAPSSSYEQGRVSRNITYQPVFVLGVRIPNSENLRKDHGIGWKRSPAHSGGDERRRVCKGRITFLERSPQLSSGFYGYTGAFCLPMCQSSTGRRDCAVLVSLDISGIATTVDPHLYDVLGIWLEMQQQSVRLLDH